MPWHNYGIQHRDVDSIAIGEADLPAAGDLDDVAVADWDIHGSFQILKPGWIDVEVFYRLNLITVTGQTLTGEIGPGNGASLWVSEGGTGALTRLVFIGLDPVGGIGAHEDYPLRYRGFHSDNTRFVILHRIPSTTTLAATDADDMPANQWSNVDQEALGKSHSS